MNSLLARSSTYLIVAGVIAALFGVVAMFSPVATVIALVILWGVYALIDGFTAAFLAFQKQSGRSRLFLIITAILSLLVGVMAVIYPLTAGQALAWVVGIWLIVRGVMEIFAAFGHPGGTRWWLLIGGILWVIAGWLFMSYPGAALLTVSIWIGALALVWGITLIIAGVQARRHVGTTA